MEWRESFSSCCPKKCSTPITGSSNTRQREYTVLSFSNKVFQSFLENKVPQKKININKPIVSSTDLILYVLSSTYSILLIV